MIMIMFMSMMMRKDGDNGECDDMMVIVMVGNMMISMGGW